MLVKDSEIVSIADFSDSLYSGFLIKTKDNVILLGIEHGQHCCESWGYFMSHENFHDFIGSKILDVCITDSQLNTVEFQKEYFGCAVFVNIETSVGKLQFVAYNEHNGYYSHEVVVKIDSEIIEHEWI